MASDGAKVVGDGGGRLIQIEGSFIVVRGFEISDADILVWIQHAHGVRLARNLLHDAGSECVRIKYLASDNVLAHNRIVRNRSHVPAECVDVKEGSARNPGGAQQLYRRPGPGQRRLLIARTAHALHRERLSGHGGRRYPPRW
ncbi:MAG TPA: hypothetical protein VE646_05895 [Actinomycetota bacterium]|nr:hypothetical protein [Actinomycetota bacterium]